MRVVRCTRRARLLDKRGLSSKLRKTYTETPTPILNATQMHIPPWLWFSSINSSRENPAKSAGKLILSVYPRSIFFHSSAQRGLSPI